MEDIMKIFNWRWFRLKSARRSLFQQQMLEFEGNMRKLTLEELEEESFRLMAFNMRPGYKQKIIYVDGLIDKLKKENK